MCLHSYRDTCWRKQGFSTRLKWLKMEKRSGESTTIVKVRCVLVSVLWVLSEVTVSADFWTGRTGASRGLSCMEGSSHFIKTPDQPGMQ